MNCCENIFCSSVNQFFMRYFQKKFFYPILLLLSCRAYFYGPGKGTLAFFGPKLHPGATLFGLVKIFCELNSQFIKLEGIETIVKCAMLCLFKWPLIDRESCYCVHSN